MAAEGSPRAQLAPLQLYTKICAKWFRASRAVAALLRDHQRVARRGAAAAASPARVAVERATLHTDVADGHQLRAAVLVDVQALW